MAKTVLINPNGNVDNVIRLVPGTPYDPPSGMTMITVDDATPVSPGMRYIEGSAPPAFEDVPVDETPTGPATVAEAMAIVEAKQAETAQAIEDLKHITSVG